MQGPLLVLGLGKFGAAAVAHLQSLGLSRPGLVLLTFASSTASRQEGAEQLRRRLAEGWPELAAGLRGEVAVIAAAGEAAGGGAAMAALQWLAGRGVRPTLWLAVPGEGADGLQRARAAATLLELEAFAAEGGGVRCCLQVLRPQWIEQAAALGAAALADAAAQQPAAALPRTGHPIPAAAQTGQPTSRPTGAGVAYAGCAFGIVLDPVAALVGQLAPRLLARVLQARTPGSAADGASEGAAAGLVGALGVALAPLAQGAQQSGAYERRWRAEAVGTAAHGEVAARQLASQEQFYTLIFTTRVHLYFDGQAELARQSCRKLLRGAPAAVAAAALRQLTARLQTLAASCATVASELQAEIARMTEELHATQGAARTTALGGMRLTSLLDERSSLLARAAIEQGRQVALLALATQLPEELASDLAGAALREERWAALLARTRDLARQPAPFAGRHVLAPQLPAEQLSRWATEMDASRVELTLGGSTLPEFPALLADARRDVARFLSTAGVQLHLPRQHPDRLAWQRGLFADLPADGWACWVHPRLPADYRADLAEQAQCAPALLPAELLGSDAWPVFGLRPFTGLRQLAVWPDLLAAYEGQPAASRATLHTRRLAPAYAAPAPMPKPPAAHVQVITQERVAAEPHAAHTVQAADRCLLRACLLGLVTPAPPGLRGQGGALAQLPLQACYLQPGGAIVRRPLGSLAQAQAALRNTPDLRTALAGLAETWMANFGPSQWQAWLELLNWFDAELLGCQPGGGTAALRAALASERAAASGAAVPAAPPGIAVLPSGWRYLQW